MPHPKAAGPWHNQIFGIPRAYIHPHRAIKFCMVIKVGKRKEESIYVYQASSPMGGVSSQKIYSTNADVQSVCSS